MLTGIELKNFKLHAETKIEAAPVTVFIGPNNSGKSSVFQSLLLWRQAALRNENRLCLGWKKGNEPYVFFEDQLIDIGEFDQVVRRGAREVLVRVSGAYPQNKTIEYGPGPTDGDFEVRVRENNLVYHRGNVAYEIATLNLRRQFSWEWSFGRPRGQYGLALSLPDKDFELNCRPAANFSLFETTGYSSQGQLTPEENVAVQELSVRFGEGARTLLNSVHPVFPLRGFEEVSYPLPDAPAHNLDRMAVADRTMALLSLLAYNRDIEHRLSEWLKGLIGIRIETKLLPGKRVTILSSPAGSSRAGSLFSNEGTGTSQLPFILVPIGLTPPGETIFLSEPEVHLHPRLQVELGKLLIRLAKEEKRQFFVETHSEHVLHALLNAVAKGELEQHDLAIYYFENKDGRAVCTRLEVDERGGVKGGLPGFFDQSPGELTEYLDALKTK